MKKLVVIGASLAAFGIAAWFVRSPPAGDAGIAKSPELASPLPPPPSARESAEPGPVVKSSEPIALAPARESHERQVHGPRRQTLYSPFSRP